MKTQKCIECGTRHHNTNVEKELLPRCWNCQIVVDMLNAFVKATNMHKPLNGNPRKLTITGYSIEKL